MGSEDELAGELARLKPGDTLWLTVLRESEKGQPKAVKIPIKLAPPQGTGAAAPRNNLTLREPTRRFPARGRAIVIFANMTASGGGGSPRLG